MKRLAARDMKVEIVGLGRGDEIGRMADARRRAYSADVVDIKSAGQSRWVDRRPINKPRRAHIATEYSSFCCQRNKD
jgi:hypothetical protein